MITGARSHGGEKVFVGKGAHAPILYQHDLFTIRCGGACGAARVRPIQRIDELSRRLSRQP